MKTEQNESLFLKEDGFLESMFQKFRATQLLAFSFVLVIFLGSILLSLPIANKQGIHTSYLNHLFVSTSAVCVTGLSPIVVAEQYSLFGKIVLIFLMQIGGLGLMSFIALIVLARREKMSLAEKNVFATATGKSNFDNVNVYIKKIFKYTIFFELIGIILLSTRFIKDFGVGKGIFYSIFLSVSAFTNSGLDPLGANSLMDYATSPIVSLTIVGLIIVGGLGFVVWFELRERIFKKYANQFDLRATWTNFSVHTKVVLNTTFYLILIGTLLFLVIEFLNPNTISDNNFFEKILISLFQSVTLRTAGFSTVNIGLCMRATCLFMLVFMLIGGSPGGTAGGMKTTTFAVLIAMIISAFKGRETSCRIYHRHIARADFIRAFLIFALYFLFIFVCAMILFTTESNLDTFAIIFEEVSAIGTVGLSMGITASLSSIGKIVIILLMFAGRIGPFVMIEIFFLHKTQKVQKTIRYPNADIMIG